MNTSTPFDLAVVQVGVGRVDSVARFKGVTGLLGSMPEELVIWGLRNIHPDSATMLQLGANVDVDSELDSRFLFSQSGPSVTYALLDANYNLSAEYVVRLCLPIFAAWRCHFRFSADTRYNLLLFLGMVYRVPPAHVYLAGVLVRVSSARVGRAAGRMQVDPAIAVPY